MNAKCEHETEHYEYEIDLNMYKKYKTFNETSNMKQNIINMKRN